MRNLALVAIALLPACREPTSFDGGQSGQNDHGDGCAPRLTTVVADDVSLGFSATDAMRLVQDHRPVEVAWTEITQGDIVTDATLTLTVEGSPERAEPGGDTTLCVETTPWLRIPVTMELTLAGGEVVASGPTHLDVGALDLSRVHLTTAWSLPAALSGAYATQFDAYLRAFRADYAPVTVTSEGTWVLVAGTWTSPAVGIAWRYRMPDGGGFATAWRGTWSLP